MRLSKLFSVALALTLATAAVSSTRADSVVVTNSNAALTGWSFDTRDGTGNVLSTGANTYTNFVNGPSTPPLGTGSALLDASPALANTDGGGAAELRNTNYSGVLLSSISTLQYSTYMSNNEPGGQQFPYLRLWISYNGTSYDDSLFFEPPYQTPSTGNPSLPDQGATAMNTWQQWDALNGGWWANSGFGGSGGTNVGSLKDYETLHPNAQIINVDYGSGPFGGVGFATGFADPGTDYNGNVDAFTIGINGNNTTFNFEAAAPTPLPSVAGLGTALLGLTAAGLFFGKKLRPRTA